MPDGRAPVWRGVALLVVVALAAAACSASPPVGSIGTTLPAMNGTVTLDKVIAPATAAGRAFAPAAGFRLVAVVLTVHSPAGAPGKFTATYSVSKLVSSTKITAHAKSTAQLPVTECAAYAPLASLAPGASQTGCEVFQLPVSAIPTELKIAGKAKANWLIAASGIQPGTGTTAPPPVATTAPTTTTTGATADTGNTGNTGNSGTGTTTTTAVPGSSALPTTTTTASTTAARKRQRHHVAFTVLPHIRHVTPRRGFVGGQVTITGRKLGSLVSVTFNGIPATVVRSTSDRIIVTVPFGATTGPVVVTTATGSVASPKSFELP